MRGVSLRSRAWPCPLFNLGHVDAILIGVVLAVDLPVAQIPPLREPRPLAERHPVNHVDCKAEAVGFVLDSQFQRRIDVAFFLVTAHVQVLVVVAAISRGDGSTTGNHGS